MGGLGLDQGFCGLRGASGSMKLFSSVSSCGGPELSSWSKITKTRYSYGKWFPCSPATPPHHPRLHLCSRGCPCSLLRSWEDRRSRGSRACKASGPTSFPCSGHTTNKVHREKTQTQVSGDYICDLFDLSEQTLNSYNIGVLPQLPTGILELIQSHFSKAVNAPFGTF